MPPPRKPAAAGHEHEVVEERRDAAHIEYDDVLGFVVVADAGTHKGPVFGRREMGGGGWGGFEGRERFQRTSWRLGFADAAVGIRTDLGRKTPQTSFRFGRPHEVRGALRRGARI